MKYYIVIGACWGTSGRYCQITRRYWYHSGNTCGLGFRLIKTIKK